MIICTIVVYRQLAYIDRKDLGMDRENVVFAEMRGKTAESFRELKNVFLQNPSIISVTRGNGLPFEIGSNSGGFDWEGRETKDEVLIGFGCADVDYVKTIGMKMVAGRYFEEGYSTDTSSAIVLNETAVKVMGMEDPIGKWVTWNGQKMTVIGVIKDFHFLPMTEEISPLVLVDAPKWCSTIFVKVNRWEIWTRPLIICRMPGKKSIPAFRLNISYSMPPMMSFMSEEDRLGKIFRYFSILTILISCLGLVRPGCIHG